MSTSSSLTIENLLSLLVCEWQNTRYSPMGRPLDGVHEDGNELSISLTPLTMHQSGCPQNFGEFYHACSSLNGITRREAFGWYCKTRLHYSCSTICVMFSEFIVPELRKRGIKTLHVSTPLDNIDQVHLEKIKVKGVHIVFVWLVSQATKWKSK